VRGFAGRADPNYTIFEGTSEIQRLVVARAISGVHIP
jgi:alkylation response protein AidB-like acyl-CoA dehydrogenase